MTFIQGSDRRIWAAIVCSLVVTGCPPGSRPPTGGAAPKSLVVAGVVGDNFRLHPSAFYENTAKVVGPTAACPQGAIVVSTGEPRSSARLLSGPLLDGSGNLETTELVRQAAYPVGPSEAIATDNQTVRLTDGSLLSVKDAYFWSPMSPPPRWSQEVVSGSGDRVGQRGGVLLFRSTDCGFSWQRHAAIDMGTFRGGIYGIPRPRNSQGNDVAHTEQGIDATTGRLQWWVGGADRTEVYVCPFTGHVYLTTVVVSGPFEPGQSKFHATVLLMSTDSAQSWEVVRDDLRGSGPTVMTSTPDGRLFLFQQWGTQPIIYVSHAPIRAGTKPVLSGNELPVNYVEGGGLVAAATASQIRGEVAIGYKIPSPSISRVSTDRCSSKVRASYGVRNHHGMHEVRVIEIESIDGEPLAVTALAKIAASDPKNSSVMYFAFIEPDYIDTPFGFASSLTAAYWMEAPRVGHSSPAYSVHYTLFRGELPPDPPAALSVSQGVARAWSARREVGDYMTGGFWWEPGQLSYLAQWVEPTGIVANVIRVSDPTAHSSSGLTPSKWVQGYTIDAFKRWDTDIRDDGWVLQGMSTWVNADGDVRVDGVWHRTPGQATWVQGYTADSFKRRDAEMSAAGWRLQTMSSSVLADGAVRVDGVWHRTPGQTTWVQGYTIESFERRHTELKAAGWQLQTLSSVVLASGDVRVDALWHRRSGDARWVHGYTADSFRRRDRELVEEGYRVQTISTSVQRDGTQRLDAVWHKPSSARMWARGFSLKSFECKHSQAVIDGWSLVSLSSFQKANGAVRVDAVWSQ